MAFAWPEGWVPSLGVFLPSATRKQHQERTRLQLNHQLLAAAPQAGLGSLGPLQKDQPRPGWSGAWVHIGGLLLLPCPTVTWDVSGICREPGTLESRPEGELACHPNRPACCDLPAPQQASVLRAEAAPLPSGLNAPPLCPGERRLLAGPWQPPHSPRHVWPQALGLRPNTLGGGRGGCSGFTLPSWKINC